jgi:hypothetical protein
MSKIIFLSCTSKLLVVVGAAAAAVVVMILFMAIFKYYTSKSNVKFTT